MVDPPRYPGTGTGHDQESTTGMPRWLKVVGLALIMLLLLVVVVMLVGGGGHGPRRHATTGGDTGNTPPGLYALAAYRLPPP